MTRFALDPAKGVLSGANPDMKTAAWPRREVNVGFNDRLTTGCAGPPGNGLTMCVQGLVTRGQIAEFLGRTIGLVPNP